MAVSLNLAYSWAINTCNADNVGYSQTYRNAQTVKGVTYYDCSSFIWYALKYGDFDVETAYNSTWPFTTGTMGSVLETLGFTKIACDVNQIVLAGDILWRSGHTEMVYTGGTGSCVTMGAHSSKYDLADQVSINSYSTDITNYTYIYRYGTGGATAVHAYSVYAIAAMCGNWYVESGCNPGIWESLTETATWTSLTVGYGLGQWTNTGGDTNGRLYQLHEYLSENGYDDDSGEGELEFLIYEAVWYTGDSKPYSSLFESLEDFLTTTETDLTTLTYAFLEGWEGIWNGTQDTRAEAAKTAYDYIVAHADDEDITTWISGNFYMTEAQWLNNCVLIYRYMCLGSGSGTGGGGTAKKKGLKVWQMLPWWYWL